MAGDLNLTNRRENKRLAVVVSVRPDAQVHLLGVVVPLEGLSDSQDGVRRPHLHPGPEGGIPGGCQTRDGRPLEAGGGCGEHRSASSHTVENYPLHITQNCDNSCKTVSQE